MHRSVYVGLTIALLSLLLAGGSALFSGGGLSGGLFSGGVSSGDLRSGETPHTSVGSVVDAQPTSEPTEPATEPIERSNEEGADPPAQLVEDLKSVVSTRTGIPSYEIMFVSAEAVEWSDACLGIPNPDEFCAQVITPGYRITLRTMTEEYVFHTDRTGDSIRLADDR